MRNIVSRNRKRSEKVTTMSTNYKIASQLFASCITLSHCRQLITLISPLDLQAPFALLCHIIPAPSPCRPYLDTSSSARYALAFRSLFFLRLIITDTASLRPLLPRPQAMSWPPFVVYTHCDWIWQASISARHCRNSQAAATLYPPHIAAH